jgi:bifunctional DNA-binding transcriptional regulator/antitoxin component of YhaV-PrlF toxin-antitoxin module
MAVAVLTVTSRGQVTFRRDVLKHLGLKPGDRLEVELLPGGRVQLSATRPRGSIEDLYAMLWDRTNGERLSVGEIESVIGAGRPEAGPRSRPASGPGAVGPAGS